MNKKHVPDTIAAPVAAYSHGIEVPPNSRVLYTAGQVGILPDGTTPDGVEAQTEATWVNLMAILESSPHRHTRVNVVRLILRASKWTAIRQLIDATGLVDVHSESIVLSAVDQWISRANRSFVGPSKSEAERLRESLAASGSRLGSRAEEVSSYLKTWS